MLTRSEELLLYLYRQARRGPTNGFNSPRLPTIGPDIRFMVPFGWFYVLHCDVEMIFYG